ncbi:MAG: glutathione S-transferase [Burkholderiaceae bacterium]
MKLHWSPKSPYVRKVMVVAHKLKLLPQITLVRSVAAMRVPNTELMRDNPLSKIPTLVLDDGATLFDSSVICEYLNALAQGTLFPASGAARWQALRWQAFGDGMLDALILWRNERERLDISRSAELLQAFETKTHAALARLQVEAAELVDAPYAIGHVTLGCALGYLDFRFPDIDWRARAPAMASWFASQQLQSAWVATEPTLDG